MVTFRYKIGKLFYQNILWYHKNYVTLHQKSETLSHMNTKKDHQQQVEKPRAFDPRGQATVTPRGKI